MLQLRKSVVRWGCGLDMLSRNPGATGWGLLAHVSAGMQHVSASARHSHLGLIYALQVGAMGFDGASCSHCDCCVSTEHAE
jgi:hypothetical protein